MQIAGSSIKWPFAVDSRGTLVTTSDREQLIVDAIRDVLETRVGERVMLSRYGLRDWIFSVQDATFGTRLAYELREQIVNYIPLVKDVKVNTATDEDGRAVVNVRYQEVGTVSAPRNLVFPVWRLTE